MDENVFDLALFLIVERVAFFLGNLFRSTLLEAVELKVVLVEDCDKRFCQDFFLVDLLGLLYPNVT